VTTITNSNFIKTKINLFKTNMNFKLENRINYSHPNSDMNSNYSLIKNYSHYSKSIIFTLKLMNSKNSSSLIKTFYKLLSSFNFPIIHFLPLITIIKFLNIS
jgi:hypothetical protein